MNQIKKAPRKKAYKFMSVSELVAARKELSSKIEQIDTILNEAVEAVGSIKRPMKSGYIKLGQNVSTDSAFVERTNLNQVPISKEAPILTAISRTATDQSSGFSIFDAESAAREQSNAELEYLKNNNDIVVPTDSFDFNEQDITNEINSLKQDIKNTLESNA